MTENSRAGLTMLAPDREVLLAGEECHQPALQAYATEGDGRHVVVVLGFARGAAEQRRGIEVRLDGQRVGELTAPLSERYARLLDDMRLHGGRPGCVAQVVHSADGLGLELRLPTVPVVPVVPAGPSLPASVGTAADPPRARQRTPYLVGAGVAALLIVLGVGLGHGGGATVPTADGAAAVVATTTVTPVPPRTPDVTTVQRAAPGPSPRPATAPGPQPAPQRESEAAPGNEGAPSDPCDPDYSECVPVAGDVDCADENGDGPASMSGPVAVTGTDVLDLDPDPDGDGDGDGDGGGTGC